VTSSYEWVITGLERLLDETKEASAEQGTQYGKEGGRIAAVSVMSLVTMRDAHIFEMDQEVLAFCGKVPNEPRGGPLPFDSCWLEGPLPIAGRSTWGILVETITHRLDAVQQIFELVGKAKGEEKEEFTKATLQLEKEKVQFSDAVACTVFLKLDDQDAFGSDSFLLVPNKVLEENLSGPRHPKDEAELWGGLRDTFIHEARVFIQNWCDLVNGPQVRLVRAKRARILDPARGQRETTPRYYPATKIILKTELLRYVRQARLQEQSPASHKFWVRGHWRTLRDEARWTKKLNMRVWVRPFIKGFGELIEKHYEHVGKERQKRPNCKFDGPPTFSDPGSFASTLQEEPE